jgi:CRISPR system Cascade subunit CasE
MMIASVLHLGRTDVKALNITDTYSIHRVVYDLFDDTRSESEKQQSISSGILYVDKGGDSRSRKILMLSNRQPNAPIHGELSMRKISNDFLDYPHYRFEVVINPTKRESGGGKLIPLRTRENIAKWFFEKAPQWGFEVKPEHLAVGNVSVKQFQKEKEGREITQAQAQILGRLTVTDKAKFVQSFQQGIGRGRSFGCGLLQIVPI